MIISITCRHGTETNICRSEIGRELIQFSKFGNLITRAQVVLSKETHHKNSGDLVTCHLSVHIPKRRAIDVYERRSTEKKSILSGARKNIGTNSAYLFINKAFLCPISR